MASHTMNGQVTRNQRRSGLAVGLRALFAVTLASALLAGCSTPLERQTKATALTSAGDAQATADKTGRFATDAPETDLAIAGSDYHADTLPCLARPTDCRVRDLRTPWEERRYLMPDGTLSAPPGSEARR